jgi:hypothetical protein
MLDAELEKTVRRLVDACVELLERDRIIPELENDVIGIGKRRDRDIVSLCLL